MARIIIWHKVKDFDAWKQTYDEDSPRRDAAGIKELSITRGALDPNTLTIEFEAEDPSVMQQMLQDPDLKAKMEEGGVEAMDYYI